MGKPAARDRSAPPPRAVAVLLALIAAAAAVFVYRGTLAYFFAQDDFAGLARARGILPALEGPWRYLSGQLYFDALRALADLDPRPYRAISLAVHAITSALLFVWLRRLVSPAAALVGAVFFAAHPAIFTGLYSISGIGELLAGAFAVLTLIAVAQPGRVRWLAVPAFALSLLAKETAVLLPVVLYVMERRSADVRRPAPWTKPDAVILALAALSLACLVTFFATDFFGVRRAMTNEAYAVHLDDTLWKNALTYLGWTLNCGFLTVRGFHDAIDPSVFAWGGAAFVVWIVGAFLPALRRRGWLVAGAWFATTIAPVLPLANHTYHYYLYLPLLGAAWCVAGLADVVLARVPRTVAWAASGLAVVLLIANGAALVRKIETMPFSHPELRADPTVDRNLIARRVQQDLQGSAIPTGSELRFWSPASIDLERTLRGPAAAERETYWERNVRTALLDGIGVRVLFPDVREVRFVRAFEPAGDSVRYAVYRVDGSLRVGSPAELEAVLGSEGER